MGTVVGIDVAPDGTLVLSDISGVRVTLFAADGEFLSNSGKDVSVGGGTGPEICTHDCKGGEAGSAGGELSSPWGVAAGPNEFYVSELTNSRISVFDYHGKFLRAFGADVGGPGLDTCTTNCESGTSGPGDGQMAGPAGLALNASGNLLVSQLGTHRVDTFNPRTGAFLGAFGKNVGGLGVNSCSTGCQAGTADETPGSLNSAYGLAVGPSGEVLLSDNQTVNTPSSPPRANSCAPLAPRGPAQVSSSARSEWQSGPMGTSMCPRAPTTASRSLTSTGPFCGPLAKT